MDELGKLIQLVNDNPEEGFLDHLYKVSLELEKQLKAEMAGEAKAKELHMEVRARHHGLRADTLHACLSGVKTAIQVIQTQRRDLALVHQAMANTATSILSKELMNLLETTRTTNKKVIDPNTRKLDS